MAWVRNVALLILAGDVLSIPATGEHQLEADTVSAVGIEVGLVWEEVTVKGAFWGLGVIETVKSDGSLAEEGLLSVFAGPEGLLDVRDGVGEVTLIGVACDHLEASGEGGEGSVACVGVEEVVSGRMLDIIGGRQRTIANLSKRNVNM